MNKGILDIYLDNPANYIFAGDGGFGKTTQLLAMQKDLLGKQIKVGEEELTCIPIYFKMSKINRMSNVGDDFFLDSVAKFFHYSSKDSEAGLSPADMVRTLIKENSAGYQYLFLLDGMNEVVSNIKLDSRLANGIYELVTMSPRIHVIATTRSEKNQENVRLLNGNTTRTQRGLRGKNGEDVEISEELEDYFFYYYLQELNTDNINSYMGDRKVSKEIGKLINVPMMAKMYRFILNVQKDYQFTQKSELMTHYLYLNTEEKRVAVFDEMVDLRQMIVEKILPCLAFEAELSIITKKAQKDCSRDKSIREFVTQTIPKMTACIDDIIQLVDSMHIVDAEMNFSHQLYRDYFAVRGLLLETDPHRSEEFMNALNSALEYDFDSVTRPDLERRTQYLDVAEFLKAEVGSRLTSWLCDRYPADSLLPTLLSEEYYEQLAGVYDDLRVKDDCADNGWIAYDYLSKISNMPGVIDDYTCAKKQNAIYYCILKIDKSGSKEKHYTDPLEIAEVVKKYVEDPAHNSRKDQELLAKYYSNMGAYYTSDWHHASKSEKYAKAFLWHDKALKLRQKWYQTELLKQDRPIFDRGGRDSFQKELESFRKQVLDSYRTVMGDYYYQNRHEEAFRLYKEALQYCYPSFKEEELYQANGLISEDFAERALGSLFPLLRECDPAQRDALLKEAESMVAYVYRMCTDKLSRAARTELDSLKKKLSALLEDRQNLPFELPDSFQEYHERIDKALYI